MFRSRTPRAVVAALTAVVLIVGLMASTTLAAPSQSTAGGVAALAKPKATPTPPAPTPTPVPTPTPTPTPNSDSRSVYIGDAPKSPSGAGKLDPTPASVGNTFLVDVFVENLGNQTLTHAEFGFGTAPAPALPAGLVILDAITDEPGCDEVSAPTTTFFCDLSNFSGGDTLEVRFRMQANAAVDATLTAALKVAENIGGDPGANPNTFLATYDLEINATNSDNVGDFIETGPFTLSTDGQPEVDGDVQKTTVGPGPNSAAAGFISIVETNDPDGCPNAGCIGQEVALNVNDGAAVVPYLEWLFEIEGLGGGSKGGVMHDGEDDGSFLNIPNTPANKCTANKTFDCIVSYTVSNKDNATTIVFRTLTNGKAKAY